MTGVQTCALPISSGARSGSIRSPGTSARCGGPPRRPGPGSAVGHQLDALQEPAAPDVADDLVFAGQPFHMFPPVGADSLGDIDQHLLQYDVYAGDGGVAGHRVVGMGVPHDKPG